MRRFESGQRFEFPNAPPLAVQKGKKSDNDLVLLWKVDGHYQPIHYDIVALMVAFFAENEDRLYPPEQGYQGREKFTSFVLDAIHYGHEIAIEMLRIEK